MHSFKTQVQLCNTASLNNRVECLVRMQNNMKWMSAVLKFNTHFKGSAVTPWGLLLGLSTNCLWTLQDVRNSRKSQSLFSVEITRKISFLLTTTINAFKHAKSSKDFLSNSEEITSDRITTLYVYPEPCRRTRVRFVNSAIVCFDFTTGLLKCLKKGRDWKHEA